MISRFLDSSSFLIGSSSVFESGGAGSVLEASEEEVEAASGAAE